MTSLDFRKTKKNYLKVTLNDDAETNLSIMQPTKELFERMVAMSEEVANISGSDLEALDEVYGVCAELMSRNKEGLIVSKSNLEATLDFEDIVMFLQAYSAFVAGIVHGKN
ncbi:MAG: hypothetical protein IKL97_07120 [Eggerthellaceae bacterium]|nr:hypothetical protein [Eggerthellaceae bacterium]